MKPRRILSVVLAFAMLVSTPGQILAEADLGTAQESVMEDNNSLSDPGLEMEQAVENQVVADLAVSDQAMANQAMASQTAADQPTLNQPTEIVKTTGEPVAESTAVLAAREERSRSIIPAAALA